MTEHHGGFTIRQAQPEDSTVLFDLILGLAAYEQLTHAVSGSADKLRRDLFGERPYAEALLAEADGRAVGLALFFPNYSTFATCPGLYLEDLFVIPEYRGRGIGRALIGRVAQLALERGFSRVDWAVLDWNESAIGFYDRLGAQVLPDWHICRLSGPGLKEMVDGAR